MDLNALQVSRPPTGVPGTGPKAHTPEEAAQQFEEILIRQFTQTMTKGLFESSLAGEDGPGWMKGHQSQQQDILAGELAKHLMASGTLRLSELLLRQWNRNDVLPETDTTPPESTQTPSTP